MNTTTIVSQQQVKSHGLASAHLVQITVRTFKITYFFRRNINGLVDNPNLESEWQDL